MRSVSFAHPAPIANYTVDKICFGDTTHFTNTSILGVNYKWEVFQNINDSLVKVAHSTAFNFAYFFAEQDTFIAMLTVDNGHTKIISHEFIIGIETKANFEFYPCQSQFVNLSYCSDTFFWDFGDGTTSTSVSPTHNYTSGGNYNVTLIAKAGSSIDTFTYAITITPSGLTGNFITRSDADSIYFTAVDTTFGPYIEYHWSFGDGATADIYGLWGRWASHHYEVKDSSYQAFLLVKTVCYQAFNFKDIYIPYAGEINSIILFPNPSNETVKIRGENWGSYNSFNVFNELGQSVNVPIQKYTPQGFDLDVSDLAGGIYYIRISVGENLYTRKLLVN